MKVGSAKQRLPVHDNLAVRVNRLADPGALPADTFRYEAIPLPELSAGEVLVEALCQTIDAGSRAMLEPSTDYVFKLSPGSRVPASATLGRIVRSRDPRYPEGTLVRSLRGVRQRYLAMNPDTTLGFAAIRPGTDPFAWIGVLGMTGFTAWLGITDICRPEPGQTLVVSAAAGAVGSAAVQFGRLRGARVVGIAGGTDKCDWVVRELGFAACVDYRASDFPAALAAACPAGIDAYFENVGGAVQQAVFPLMNDFGRIAMCGQVAQYSGAGEQPGPNLMVVVLRRLELKGFLASDHFGRLDAFLEQAGAWAAAGQLVQPVSISAGTQALHEAINMLAQGRNCGQQVHQWCSDAELAAAFSGAGFSPR